MHVSIVEIAAVCSFDETLFCSLQTVLFVERAWRSSLCLKHGRTLD